MSEISPAADWWSYGAILLLLYTGTLKGLFTNFQNFAVDSAESTSTRYIGLLALVCMIYHLFKLVCFSRLLVEFGYLTTNL